MIVIAFNQQIDMIVTKLFCLELIGIMGKQNMWLFCTSENNMTHWFCVFLFFFVIYEI